MVQAATKAGNGKPSDPIIIVAGGSPSKNPTSSGEQKPSPNVKPDQSLGKGYILINKKYICLVFIYDSIKNHFKIMLY